jgi:hypothetical protein
MHWASTADIVRVNKHALAGERGSQRGCHEELLILVFVKSDSHVLRASTADLAIQSHKDMPIAELENIDNKGLSDRADTVRRQRRRRRTEADNAEHQDA